MYRSRNNPLMFPVCSGEPWTWNKSLFSSPSKVWAKPMHCLIYSMWQKGLLPIFSLLFYRSCCSSEFELSRELGRNWRVNKAYILWDSNKEWHCIFYHCIFSLKCFSVFLTAEWKWVIMSSRDTQGLISCLKAFPLLQEGFLRKINTAQSSYWLHRISVAHQGMDLFFFFMQMEPQIGLLSMYMMLLAAVKSLCWRNLLKCRVYPLFRFLWGLFVILLQLQNVLRAVTLLGKCIELNKAFLSLETVLDQSISVRC